MKSKKGLTEKSNHMHESEHSHDACGLEQTNHACACGHSHDEANVEIETKQRSGSKQHIFQLENIGCAGCAAKMEQKIGELAGIDSIAITYATKQMRVQTSDIKNLLPVITKICTDIESGIKIIPANSHKEKDNEKEKHNDKLELAALLGGAALLLAGKALETAFPLPSVILLIGAYLVLGLPVLKEAVKNIGKGQIFDENFLMSVATLGAFAIRNYAEAVGVMLFYRVGEYFEHKAVEKSRSQIMTAIDMRPETVNIVVKDGFRVIDAKDAKVGDILMVRPGDRIPLDGIVSEGESRIDTSPVTGEPVPVKVAVGDAVTSGCVNTSGLIQMRVEKVLEESMVTRILNAVENAAANKPNIEKFITRFSRVYTPFVIAIAIFTAIVPSMVTGDWNRWVYTALEFLVISCPCALVLSVPLAFFSGIGAGSKRGILFKGGTSLEALKNVNAVIMDKTGTITKGNFAVQQMIPVENIDKKDLLLLAAACEITSTHPIGNSIVEAAKQDGLIPMQPEFVEEIVGKGIHAKIDGADILCGNGKLMEQFHVQVEELAAKSHGTQVLLAKNGSYIGQLLIADTVKPDAAEAVSRLKALGIVTAMLTGDGEGNARSVAEETGIDEVYAKLMPGDKLSKLEAIRGKHGVTMFVGDGINDAPVLAGADVGAAMGTGADAAIEAADVVFMKSEMEAIPTAIAIAKKTGQIALQNVIFALGIKVIIMILGFMGSVSMWMAVFADSGVTMLCVLNAIRILYGKHK